MASNTTGYLTLKKEYWHLFFPSISSWHLIHQFLSLNSMSWNNCASFASILYNLRCWRESLLMPVLKSQKIAIKCLPLVNCVSFETEIWNMTGCNLPFLPGFLLHVLQATTSNKEKERKRCGKGEKIRSGYVTSVKKIIEKMNLF